MFDELVLVSLSCKLMKDQRENWICPIWPQLLTWKYGEYTGGWRPSLPGLGSSWENWWKKFPRFQAFEIGYWKQKQSQMFKGEVLEFNSIQNLIVTNCRCQVELHLRTKSKPAFFTGQLQFDNIIYIIWKLNYFIQNITSELLEERFVKRFQIGLLAPTGALFWYNVYYVQCAWFFFHWIDWRPPGSSFVPLSADHPHLAKDTSVLLIQ